MSKNFEAECDKQLNWMQSLLNGKTPQTTTSTASSKNKYESQIDDLLASIEGPPAPVSQPKISDICQQFDDLLDNRPSIEPSYLTGAIPPPEEKQYRISDPVDSEDESDCEEYYVEDAEQIRGQEIPDWARAANLLKELEAQRKIDPDQIFVGFDTSCDLSSMFEKKKKTFKVRGDSGWWAADAVTPDEEARYKKALGFA